MYSGQFSKIDGSLILAGGSNSNEAKLFDRTDIEKAVVSIYDLAKEIGTVDFANKGNMFAISGGDGYVRLFGMNISAWWYVSWILTSNIMLNLNSKYAKIIITSRRRWYRVLSTS